MVYQETGKLDTGAGKGKRLPPYPVIVSAVPHPLHQIRNTQQIVNQEGTYLPMQQEETQDIIQVMEEEVFMQQGLPHREDDFHRFPLGDLEWMQLAEVEGKANILETNSILWIVVVGNSLEDPSTLVVVGTVDIATQKC